MLIEQLREITYLSIIICVCVAVAIGGIIGLERGMKNQPAGSRTYMVVCLGSCVVMMTNQYIYHVFQTGDPIRLGAQVVSGIGFYEGAVVAGITVLLIMTIFRKFDSLVQRKSKYMRLYINFDSTNALNAFMEQCKQEDITVNDAQITKFKGKDHSEVIAMLAVKSRIKMEHSGMIACFAKMDGIKYIEEI